METKASINEILSMAADAEDTSVYSLDLDNQAMSFGALMKMSPVQPQVVGMRLPSDGIIANHKSDLYFILRL